MWRWFMLCDVHMTHLTLEYTNRDLLFTSPSTAEEASFTVHRVGATLLVDEFDVKVWLGLRM
jgi:phosphopantothenoylcysteine synthetase/decarboxylase